MKNKYLNHPMHYLAQDLSDLCKPLQQLGINYFSHVHIDNSNHFSAIGNNPEFAEFYTDNQLYNLDIHTQDTSPLGNFIIWDFINNGGEDNQLNQDSIAFGLKHTCTIIENDSSGKNYYHFSSSASSTIINQTFLANKDLLSYFIKYFKDQVNQSKDLRSAYNMKFEVKSLQDKSGFLLPNSEELINLEKNRNDFYNLIQSKLNGINLSKRELACLKLYVEGKSAKEIAQILILSYRTVENHIQSVKTKLNISSKSELIHKTLNKIELI